MKFPSIVRLPGNRKFNLEPRYYDPIKEEIRERTERIKREMEHGESTEEYLPGRITFERRSKAAPSSSFLQLLIAAILGVIIIGWLYYGDIIFNMLWLIVPAYLFFRLSKTRRKG